MSRGLVSITSIAFAAAIVAARPLRADDISPLGAGVQNYVTDTMDGSYDWYEQGFNPNAPTTGLPAAGVIQSQNNPNWSFRLQPYNQNNVLLLNSSKPVATMTFTSPVTVNALAIATATSYGPNLYSPTIHFGDGTPDYTPNLFTDPDWFGLPGSAAIYSASGRIEILPTLPGDPTDGVPGEFNVVGIAGAPVPSIRVHTFTLPASLAVHPISGITFNWSELSPAQPDTAKTAIFAISTSTDGGTTYIPGNLTASSFNADVVVEAAALPEPASTLFLAVCAGLLQRRRSK